MTETWQDAVIACENVAHAARILESKDEALTAAQDAAVLAQLERDAASEALLEAASEARAKIVEALNSGETP